MATDRKSYLLKSKRNKVQTDTLERDVINKRDITIRNKKTSGKITLPVVKGLKPDD